MRAWLLCDGTKPQVLLPHLDWLRHRAYWLLNGLLTWMAYDAKSERTRWKVVYGHYPLYASTDYGGTEGHLSEKLLPVVRGRADLYIAGHHHSMQHLAPLGDLNLIVAGSGGATSYGTDDHDPRALFARSTYGFAVLELSDRSLAIRFIDSAGTELYSSIIDRQRR
jgi:hypothetical protein